MTAYVVQNAPHAGLAPIAETAPATTANTAPCGNGIALLVKNGSGSSITVTIAVPAAKTFDGLAIGGTAAGRVVTVAANSDALIPLVDATYTDPATGLCSFAVSAITTVLCAVIAIGA
jgi:hypothetical protein